MATKKTSKTKVDRAKTSPKAQKAARRARAPQSQSLPKKLSALTSARTPTRLHGQASRKSPAPAQTLSSETVLDASKMILIGAPLNEVLTSVTRLIEAHSEGMLCSIFLLDEDSLHLRYAAAPSLPESYRAATDGIAIGPNVGSCGTAAYLRQSVFVSDISSDPKWANWRDLALKSGLRAAWSSPIMSRDGKVLGLLASIIARFDIRGRAKFS